jgi:hypothetical protein
MKMSKNEFKEMIKECLIEILAEGMGSTNKLRESLAKREVSHSRHPTDSISFGPKKPLNNSIVDKKKINEVIKNESGGDPVMASILADTAATTLPNMLMNESRNQLPTPAGSVEHVVAAHDPKDLFGDEAASKWAALAFMDSPRKF